jgi:hypothetical protein
MRVVVLACAAAWVAACGGKIRDDGEGSIDDGSGGGHDAGLDGSVEVGLDAGDDADGVVPLPGVPTTVSPTAVALIGVTPENWAIVRDSAGALVAAPLDGSTPTTLASAFKESRVFEHVAFAEISGGTLLAWSHVAGLHTLSTRSSIVGAVASADGSRVAWLETHDGTDDYRVAGVDGSGATLVSSVPSSSPCTHARAGAVGPYAIESTCEVGAPTYHLIDIDLDRAAPLVDVAPALYASVDSPATWMFVVVAGRDGVLARLDGGARSTVAHDVSSMGVFLPDDSAVLVPTGSANAIVRVDVASGTSSPLGVSGTIGYGDVANDGKTALIAGAGDALLLSSTDAPAVVKSIGAGKIVGTGAFVGPFEAHASFTADGAFVLFERAGGLSALALDADPTSAVSLAAATHVGAASTTSKAQVVFSLVGASNDLDVADARVPSSTSKLGALPTPHDFGLTADHRHVVWIETSGAKKGLNVAPLPAP